MTAGPHPLDPLTATELERAVEIIRSTGRTVHFASVDLHEPSKHAVREWGERKLTADRAIPPREARAIVRDPVNRRTSVVVVSLETGSIVAWNDIPGVQPGLMAHEYTGAEAAVKADPAWQQAVRRRGVKDIDLTIVDAWPDGPYYGESGGVVRRALGLTWVRAKPGDNAYARPVEGLVVLVDLDDMSVIGIEEDSDVPVPLLGGDYTTAMLTDPGNVAGHVRPRTGLRPLEITQPDGPSFHLDGNSLEWQNWALHIGWNSREGLVLDNIGYRDGERLRSIVYRASISELFVPYGDPGINHSRKNAFDCGENGLGFMANSLELGCDCLGEIRYLDAHLVDPFGRVQRLANAVCIHEEDFGVLWKHSDARTGTGEVRRARRLVISFIATVGNYDYGFYWYLYQDGSLEFEAKLTGIIQTGAFRDPPLYGTMVAPGLYGPNHQHFFNARLEVMIDGIDCSVVEVQPERIPTGPENRLGNAWKTGQTRFRRESEAERLLDPTSGRYWRVESTHERNSFGMPTAYKLVPGKNTLPLLADDSPAFRRGGFARSHVWVTRYADDERYAAGEWVFGSSGGGLPDYVAQDRIIDGTDIVLWYTFGTTHVVAPEDWPVMSVARVGFEFRPEGFFTFNPAMDLPAPVHMPTHGCEAQSDEAQ
jgi:primary-amine oxidase